MPAIKTLTPNETVLEALEYLNNEEQLSAFVNDPAKIRFPTSNTCQVFNVKKNSWINVLPRQYVVKGTDPIHSITLELMNRYFTVADAPSE
jgi:hypothetical protein